MEEGEHPPVPWETTWPARAGGGVPARTRVSSALDRVRALASWSWESAQPTNTAAAGPRRQRSLLFSQHFARSTTRIPLPAGPTDHVLTPRSPLPQGVCPHVPHQLHGACHVSAQSQLLAGGALCVEAHAASGLGCTWK